MEKLDSPIFSVSDFIAITNQTLEYAYPSVEIEGEVSGFKVNQGKYVFFDLKDAGGTVGCFMTVWQLRQPIEDGMKIIVSASPKLTQWGKFSLTVRSLRPSGEGNLKRSFDILQAKLEKEGLFAPERKRILPTMPRRIGVISSTQSAGYADFIRIINERWSGMCIDVAHVQVQGAAAPDQIIRALRYFNEAEALPDVIVVIRGGGSADDLNAFNDELLVREIAASRIPTLVGIGHEVDVSLAELAADVRAATPSHAAQIVVPDKVAIIATVHAQLRDTIAEQVERSIAEYSVRVKGILESALDDALQQLDRREQQLQSFRQLFEAVDPARVLARGYALVRGKRHVGEVVTVETEQDIIQAEVVHYEQK